MKCVLGGEDAKNLKIYTAEEKRIAKNCDKKVEDLPELKLKVVEAPRDEACNKYSSRNKKFHLYRVCSEKNGHLTCPKERKQLPKKRNEIKCSKFKCYLPPEKKCAKDSWVTGFCKIGK